ncbi:MAG: hypothetical protein Kow00102_03130 [Spirochaetota bacterium]|nr:hypothetical protein [Spirochaetota bacterium]
MIELYQQLYEILKNSTYSGDCFKVCDKKCISLTSTLNIEKEEYTNFVEIPFKQKKHIIAPTKKDFLAMFNPSMEENLHKDFIIVDFDGKPLVFTDGISYIDFKQDTTTYIHTIFAISRLLRFLIAPERDGFVDFVSTSIGLVTTSGKVLITYPSSCDGIDVDSINREYEKFNRLIDTFIEYGNDEKRVSFLKNAIISVCRPGEITFNEFLAKLPDIIAEATISHDIYMHSLSIDAIKKEFEEYRNKYFIELIQIQSAMTKSITAIPVSVAAYIFTMFQQAIHNELYILLLIGAMIVITGSGLIFLLRLYRYNLEYIEHISKLDFKALKKNNFFTIHTDQLEIFQSSYALIITRIKHLRIFIVLLLLFIALSHSALVWYVLQMLNMHIHSIILTVLLVLVFFGGIFYLNTAVFNKLIDKLRKYGMLLLCWKKKNTDQRK